jgi:UV DNA damage endonuclease
MIGNISLGLCCINTELRKEKVPIFSSRTCRLSTVSNLQLRCPGSGIEHVQALAKQNVKDTYKLLKWNEKHGIKTFRISSDLCPHYSNPRLSYESQSDSKLTNESVPISTPRYDIDFLSRRLGKIGRYADKYGHRLSFHPGQYNQIGAQSDSVFANTVLDLTCHTNILNEIESGLNIGDKKGILCVHGGGLYKQKKERAIERWIAGFRKLPSDVRERICLENCERCYSCEDCLLIAEALEIPLIFDTHHYDCYSIVNPDRKQKSIRKLLPRIFSTWDKRGLQPYFHISEQGSGRIGHHSDYIESIPKWMLDIDRTVSVDVEAKCKEKAIFKIVDSYSGSSSDK